MAVTVHLVLEFDNAGIEPQPWWRPFAWRRAYRDDNGHWQKVLRLGVLGIHLCCSVSWYPESAWPPKTTGE